MSIRIFLKLLMTMLRDKGLSDDKVSVTTEKDGYRIKTKSDNMLITYKRIKAAKGSFEMEDLFNDISRILQRL